MRIDNVSIINAIAPTQDWWDRVQQTPDKPLIMANMRLVLTWNEYQDLLAKDGSWTEPKD